jgi:cysteine-rich repeat protein
MRSNRSNLPTIATLPPIVDNGRPRTVLANGLARSPGARAWTSPALPLALAIVACGGDSTATTGESPSDAGSSGTASSGDGSSMHSESTTSSPSTGDEEEASSDAGDGISGGPSSTDGAVESSTDGAVESSTDGTVESSTDGADSETTSESTTSSTSESDTGGDGGTSTSDGSTTDSTDESSETDGSCGNGVVDPGEACDDGNDVDEDACTAACQPAECGDGVLQAVVGEACDEGPANGDGFSTRRLDCTVNVCGDGDVHVPSEACDTPPLPSVACDVDCTAATCGDGTVNAVAGEYCDDGNDVDDDACTNTCRNRVEDVSAGMFHTCAVGTARNVRCWGRGNFGVLGYGPGLNTLHVGDDEVPASIGDLDIGGPVIQIATGWDVSCALLDTGAVRCWGVGAVGSLGYGNTESIGDDEVVADAGDVDIGGTVVQVAAGHFHFCGLLEGGNVRCWGQGLGGRLGYGNTNIIGDNEDPAFAGDVDLSQPAVEIDAGGSHNCARFADGSIQCWGTNGNGQLGYGNTENIGDDETPASAGLVDVGGTVIQLALGDAFTCVLLDTGAVRCWGNGGAGQLGAGNTFQIGDDELPSAVGEVPVGGAVAQLSAGSLHTCARLQTGSIRCWGSGGSGGSGVFGQLGYGDTNTIGDAETPTFAGDVDLGGTAVGITAGGRHTCALLDTGNLRCWGSGSFGVLGYGNWDAIGDDEAAGAGGDVPF